MFKKAILSLAIFALLGAGLYFARPHWEEYTQRRQAKAEALSIIHAIAGKDTKVDQFSSDMDAPLKPGIFWLISVTPTKNNLYLHAVRSGDADSIVVGKLCFRKLAGSTPGHSRYYAQSLAATYDFYTLDTSPEKLVITVQFIGDNISKLVSFPKQGVFDTEPYKTLLQEENASPK